MLHDKIGKLCYSQSPTGIHPTGKHSLPTACRRSCEHTGQLWMFLEIQNMKSFGFVLPKDKRNSKGRRAIVKGQMSKTVLTAQNHRWTGLLQSWRATTEASRRWKSWIQSYFCWHGSLPSLTYSIWKTVSSEAAFLLRLLERKKRNSGWGCCSKGITGTEGGHSWHRRQCMSRLAGYWQYH